MVGGLWLVDGEFSGGRKGETDGGEGVCEEWSGVGAGEGEGGKGEKDGKKDRGRGEGAGRSPFFGCVAGNCGSGGEEGDDAGRFRLMGSGIGRSGVDLILFMGEEYAGEERG